MTRLRWSVVPIHPASNEPAKPPNFRVVGEVEERGGGASKWPATKRKRRAEGMNGIVDRRLSHEEAHLLTFMRLAGI